MNDTTAAAAASVDRERERERKICRPAMIKQEWKKN